MRLEDERFKHIFGRGVKWLSRENKAVSWGGELLEERNESIHLGHCLEILSTKREGKNRGTGWKSVQDGGGKPRLRTHFLISSAQWGAKLSSETLNRRSWVK